MPDELEMNRIADQSAANEFAVLVAAEIEKSKISELAEKLSQKRSSFFRRFWEELRHPFLLTLIGIAFTTFGGFWLENAVKTERERLVRYEQIQTQVREQRNAVIERATNLRALLLSRTTRAIHLESAISEGFDEYLVERKRSYDVASVEWTETNDIQADRLLRSMTFLAEMSSNLAPDQDYSPAIVTFNGQMSEALVRLDKLVSAMDQHLDVAYGDAVQPDPESPQIELTDEEQAQISTSGGRCTTDVCKASSSRRSAMRCMAEIEQYSAQSAMALARDLLRRNDQTISSDAAAPDFIAFEFEEFPSGACK